MNATKIYCLQSITDILNANNQSNENYQQLVNAVNELLNNDFEKLVQLLYSVDVSEKKLKSVLQDNPDQDAAVLIADLLLERQAEKKKVIPPANENIPDEDRW